MEALPSQHRTMSLVEFAPEGWSMPDSALAMYNGQNPFVLQSSDQGGSEKPYAAETYIETAPSCTQTEKSGKSFTQ